MKSVTGGRGRASLRVVAEVSGCISNRPLGQNRPVGFIARHSGTRSLFRTSGSITATRTRVSFALRTGIGRSVAIPPWYRREYAGIGIAPGMGGVSSAV